MIFLHTPVHHRGTHKTLVSAALRALKGSDHRVRAAACLALKSLALTLAPSQLQGKAELVTVCAVVRGESCQREEETRQAYWSCRGLQESYIFVKEPCMRVIHVRESASARTREREHKGK